MTEQNAQKFRPCFHMKGLLDAWQGNRLCGFVAWYVRYHVTHCTRCREALQALQKVRERLHTLRTPATVHQSSTLSPERKRQLHAAIEEIDRRRDNAASPPFD